ncbi:hypothetical protein BIZ78_gp139 [Erwinia phage vB_EamM_Caitlin]|uniref:hypothetical protein n=1 Tax=Erwinia phage vB_EamM_Caitlin TaxID=1883379 RepID=UPI00081C53FC|nr:hypothetical protein BIZ78_gp139 [Erwinia phage vB_EamM_Caitlin]ANZ48436.1 hypothetical protein CAITLIN_141 [Erwinia phage vB_EamM_Caitlin]
MGWFDWLKRDELRRIEGLREQLREQRKLRREVEGLLELNEELLQTVLGHINVQMQGGKPWAEVYNEVMAKLGDKTQAGVRQATLALMHEWQIQGKNINMIQDPVFEFPEPHRAVFPNGTEVMGLKSEPSDNTWWKEHSGR